MKLHLRQHPPCDGEHAGIRDDEGVGLYVLKLLEILLHARQVPVVGQDVGGDVDLHAPLVGEGDPLLNLLVCEILRLGPEAEGLAAQIDRVRSVDDRRL